VPFTKETILQLAVVTVAPVAPLLLTMMPLEELVKKLLGILFKWDLQQRTPFHWKWPAIASASLRRFFPAM
jgi:hypothetical protein